MSDQRPKVTPRRTKSDDVVSITQLREGWTHHFPKVFIGLAVLMALSTALMFSGLGTAPDLEDQRQRRDVVANAAGTEIRRNQLDEGMGQFASNVVDPRERLRIEGSMLQSYIDQAIKVDAARKAGITVTDEELDKEVQKLYKETADRQFAGLSPSDRARYEKQLQGYLEEREDEIRNSLLVKKWEDSLKNQVKVDDPKTKPEDIEVRARHILIPVKDPKAPPPPKNAPANTIPLPDAEAKAKAEKVLKEAKQPKADFAALAKKYSSDTGSAERGGDLDWFGKGQMVPEFDKTVYSMKPGEIAGPVKTQFGYHIIKLEDRRIGDAVKARLVDEHMKKARKTATVKVNDEVLEGMRLLNEAEQVADKPKERDRLHREALKHFEAARKEDQGNPGIVAMVGEVKKRLYNYGDKKDKKLRDEAIKELETAVKLTPAPRLRTDLAMLYEDAGKRQEALDQLKKASENAFTDKSVRYELKSGFERLGEKQLAQEQQKLLEMDMQQMQQGNFNFPGGAPGGAPVPVTPGG